jgi:ATP-dependent phosphoenolpyruvate carboxykinase
MQLQKNLETLENVIYDSVTRLIDLDDDTITEKQRHPIHWII